MARLTCGCEFDYAISSGPGEKTADLEDFVLAALEARESISVVAHGLPVNGGFVFCVHVFARLQERSPDGSSLVNCDVSGVAQLQLSGCVMLDRCRFVGGASDPSGFVFLGCLAQKLAEGF